MFACEICKFLKNTYFEEHLRTTAYNLIESAYEQVKKKIPWNS